VLYLKNKYDFENFGVRIPQVASLLGGPGLRRPC